MLACTVSAARAQSTVALHRFLPDVPAGLLPAAVTTADIDGDGNIDAAVANSGDDDVSVLWGNGDGTFIDTGITFSVGIAPVAIAIGDINHDGKLDIITADEVGSTVSVLLNQGERMFGEKISTDTGFSPESVVIGKFDADDFLDAATADDLDDTVTIFKGVGDGSFTIAQTVVVGIEVEPFGLAAEDLNNDQKIDLVLTNGGGGIDENGSVTVLKGTGTGLFELQPDIMSDLFNFPVRVTIALLNNDTIPDLVVVNETGDAVSGEGTLTILLGVGDLTFQTPANVSIGVDNNPEAAVVGDFNGDHVPDIATSGNLKDNVPVLVGLGDGTFTLAQSFDVGAGPFGIATDDFNKDGNPDLVTANMEGGTMSALISFCAGDCNGRGTVTNDELLTLVDVASGQTELGACQAGDTNMDGQISITELVTAVKKATTGCTP